MKKLIDKQQAVDALGERPMIWTEDDYELGQANQYDADKAAIENLSGIQLEPAIPVAWIEEYIERLNNTPGVFAKSRANIIQAVLDEWRGEQENMKTNDTTDRRQAGDVQGSQTVQEPHEGYWVGSDGSYVCSECGGDPIDFIETMSASSDAYMETPMSYCPHCGTKMNGIKSNVERKNHRKGA